MPSGKARVAILLLLIFALGAPPSHAAAESGIWALLQAGGQYVMIRHGVTTPGSGDPPGMRLDDCTTQRNMTDEGRVQARAIGAAFRGRVIPVASVFSSPWCRCRETARLAFGEPEVWLPLSNLFNRPEKQEGQVAEMRALVSAPRKGGNVVLVTHGSTIFALTGVSPEPAEMVILTPLGQGRFKVAGRLRLP